MNSEADQELTALRGPLLRSVSRSFYLSIRLLPRALRDPIALAYLLARATDTIADTHEIDVQSRRQHLQTLAALIQSDGAERDAEATALIQSFAPLQTDPAERTLIEQLPQILAWLRRTPAADRADIRAVLSEINEGQILDVERFGDSRGVVALQTAADLDRYTYLVAGAVGKFWTSVCFRHVPRFATLSGEKMNELGVAYGEGLQLINILRDLGPDLRGGRCYLPSEQLRDVGIAPDALAQHATDAEPVLREWRRRAVDGLAAGIEYACAIRPWRLRFATVLPALIGARTLALLEEAGPDVFTRKVKITRAEVRGILVRTAITFASPTAIRKQFAALSRPDAAASNASR